MSFSDSIRSRWREATSEGPVRDGEWAPDGGYESFVHSHQYEPLPAFDRDQAKADRREDKELFRLMKHLSELPSDAAVAEHMAGYLAQRRKEVSSSETLSGRIEVLSATRCRRIDDDGSIHEIEVGRPPR